MVSAAPGSGGSILPTCISLFTHRHAKELHERQILTLRRLCDIYKDGFYVADLVPLSEILKHVSAKVVEGHEDFVEPMCVLLYRFSVPFVKETASEEYRNFEGLCQCVAVLGQQMLAGDRRVQVAAAEMLVVYASAAEGQPATISYHHQVLEHSGIVENVAHALEKHADDLEVFVYLLRLLLELSRTRELALQIHTSGCLPTVVDAMRLGFKNECVELAVEIVWNLLELIPESADALSNEATVGVFKCLFDELLVHGFRQQDKELRNQLVVLCTYLVPQKECQQYFCSSGLLDSMMNVAFAPEADIPNSVVRAHNVTACPEDFELKRALVHVVCLLVGDEACMGEIRGHHAFLPGLVLYLNERVTEHPARRKLTKQQERLMQVHCLSSLFDLVPHTHALFLELEGPTVVLDFLAEQSEETLRSGCLKLLVNTASLPGYQAKLGGRCVAMMLSLVRERGLHPHHIRQDAMCVIARLCWGCSENQAVLSQLSGVGVLITSLEPDAGDFGRTEPMSLSAVDALWGAVAGNEQSEDTFLNEGGLEALLALFEECPVFMRTMITSCLCELLEHSQCLARIKTWRSHTTRLSIVPLLLNMWRDECVNREEEGKVQKEVSGEDFPLSSATELVRDLTGHNLQTKLHALLSKLSFQSADTLSPEQTKLLMEIRSFLATEDALLWKRFSEELKEDGIRPVTPDHRRLQDRFKRDERLAEELADEMADVDDTAEAEQQRELAQFYARVHEEQAAKRSTARRMVQGAPTSTRTKIIVDSHKAQVFPALINPQAQSATPAANSPRTQSGANAGSNTGSNAPDDISNVALPPGSRSSRPQSSQSAAEISVDQFLGDDVTSRMVSSRPPTRQSGGRPGTSGSGGRVQLPVGSAANAALALREAPVQ